MLLEWRAFLLYRLEYCELDPARDGLRVRLRWMPRLKKATKRRLRLAYVPLIAERGCPLRA